MARYEDLCSLEEDPIRERVGLPIGKQGAYFTGSKDVGGQDFDHKTVANRNKPPSGVPSLWCQWVPNENGTEIVWDGGEKFYSYVEWLEYIIANFLAPWGYTLNGTVRWRGESFDDIGKILVKDNKVTALRATF
jgi:hypothetical protein